MCIYKFLQVYAYNYADIWNLYICECIEERIINEGMDICIYIYFLITEIE